MTMETLTIATLGEEYVRDLRRRGRSRATESFYAAKLVPLERLRAPLAELTRGHVTAWMDARAPEVSAVELRRELLVLGTLLRYARRAGYPVGVMPEALPLPRARSRPRTRWLTSGEVSALVAALPGSLGAWLAFTVATGARLGEANRAEPADVDLQGGTVRIRGTKTDGSARVIPILPFARPLLEVALARCTGPMLLVPWTAASFRRVRREAARLGMAPLSPNDLRRTTATWLATSGVPLNLIAFVLGHVDSTMVERVYGKMNAASAGELIATAYRKAG
jgi:integrase